MLKDNKKKKEKNGRNVRGQMCITLDVQSSEPKIKGS